MLQQAPSKRAQACSMQFAAVFMAAFTLAFLQQLLPHRSVRTCEVCIGYYRCDDICVYSGALY
jgi:hypothetical protein